jgi:LPS-assembly lipoprotein
MLGLYLARRRPATRIGVVLMLAALTLAACGYQLRGSARLPEFLARTYIDSTTGDIQLRRELRAALATAGAEVVEQPEAATGIVRIERTDLQRRVLSIGPNGKVAENELIYTVVFSALAADVPTPVLAAQAVSVREDVPFDPDFALSAEAAERQALREMRQAAAASVVQRIGILGH